MTATALDSVRAYAAKRQQACSRVKQLIVDRLELPVPSEWITNDQPLFGRGLELDSLDALELTMGIDAALGISVYDENIARFGSVSAFIEYVTSSGAQIVGEGKGLMARDAGGAGTGAHAVTAPDSTTIVSPLRHLYPDYVELGMIEASTVPRSFGDPVGEYRAIRQEVARSDLACVNVLEVTGDDAFDLLQLALARDIEFVTPEQTLTSLVLGAGGEVVDVVTAFLTDDGFQLETSFGRGPVTVAHLKSLVAGAGLDAKIYDLAGEVSVVGVEGPGAAEVMEAAIDPEIGTLPLGGVARLDFGDGEITVSRIGYTGEFGYQMFVQRDDADRLWQLLGRVRVIGFDAIETAMLDIRHPLLHREAASGLDALACGYNWLIDITKGSFHGRDAVIRGFESGRRPVLIGWTGIDEAGRVDAPPVSGSPVTICGEAVGQVVHAVHSPALGKHLGLARLPTDLVAPGIDISVASVGGASVAARTIAAPYVVPTSWSAR